MGANRMEEIKEDVLFLAQQNGCSYRDALIDIQEQYSCPLNQNECVELMTQLGESWV